MDNKGGVERILAGLRAEYRRQLPEKLGSLRDALEALRRGGEGHELAYRLTHQLQGSAGLFGHHAVGGVARRHQMVIGPTSVIPARFVAARTVDVIRPNGIALATAHGWSRLGSDVPVQNGRGR